MSIDRAKIYGIDSDKCFSAAKMFPEFEYFNVKELLPSIAVVPKTQAALTGGEWPVIYDENGETLRIP